jgi:photosystem II stability/assembly factor-like uncharacterized protein
MKKIIAVAIFNFSLLIVNCFPQQPGWEIIPSGTTAELNSVHYISIYDLYICGEVFINVKSTDGGQTWQVNSFPVPVTLNDVFVVDQNVVVTVGNNGTILRTTDAGQNWTTVPSGVTDDLLSLSFVNEFGIAGGTSQTILYSSNSGATWNISQTGYFGGGFWGVYMLSPQLGFVAGENSIFGPLLGKTTDAGLNWDFVAFYFNSNEGRATGVDFTDMFVGYVSGRVWDGTGAIAKTTNGGNNWTTTMFGNPLWSIDFPISGASLVGYAAGSSGVILKTVNAGDTWQPQQTGTTLKLNKIYFLDLDNGFAVGENGLILRTTTGGEPVISVGDENKSPLSFQLYQNYPNPFNPSTKIKFTIPQSPLPGGDGRGGLVTLKVYDVLGNEIATLVNEDLLAGDYEVEFNGHSDEGQNLPSGIYFYQLIAGGPEMNSGQAIIQTRKMIYLK